MSSLGAWSYDSLSAFTAGLSDQCVSVELPLANTVSVYKFGETSAATAKGLREEWWRLWIVGTAADITAADYFSILWRDSSTATVNASDLTPGTTKLPFGMAPANQLPFIMVRVPRDKPYGYYLYSGSAEAVALRGCRILPPTPPLGQ